MTFPKTMVAAVVERFGDPLVLREVPVPEPGPGQALVEIIASGVCHTDLHAADGDWPAKPKVPFTPGHEGAGIVVALGSASLGCTAHAAIATSVSLGGKPSVWNRRTPAIRWTAALRSMH